MANKINKGFGVAPAAKTTHRQARTTNLPLRGVGEHELPAKDDLAKRTKEELLDEVIRLQSVLWEILVELGIARRTPHSECCFDVGFVANVKTLAKNAWTEILK